MQWDYDQELEFSVPFQKVLHIIPLSSQKILVIHHNYEFSVLKLSLPQCELLSSGTLPPLSSRFQPFSKTQIIFLNESSLTIFDWLDKSVTSALELPGSEVYHEHYDYFLGHQEIVFWKSSQLLYQYQSITYEISLFSKTNLQLLKKYKENVKSPKGVIFCCRQVAIFDQEGYKIQVHFLEDQVVQEIQSIYKLLLVSQETVQNYMVFGFTHDQLPPNEQINYKIFPQHFEKFYSPMKKPTQQWFGDHLLMLTPDLTKSYGGQKLIITVQVKYCHQFKYLLLLGCILDQAEDQLSSQIIDLLSK